MKLRFVSIPVIVLVLIAWPFLRTRQLGRNFGKLKKGDTKQAVLKQMGHPWMDTKCSYLVASPPDCTDELIYAHPYAGLIPEYWIIDFDRDQQAIFIYHTTSP